VTLTAAASTTVSGAFYRYGTDNRPLIGAAVTAANAAGGGLVFIPPSTTSYLIGGPIVALSNVTFLGSGAGSVIESLVNNSAIASASSALHDVVVDSLTFIGSITNVPTVPTGARTTSGNGVTYALWLDGDLDPHATAPPVITNVTMRNCTVRNCTQLPVWISGVRGRVLVLANHFDNCRDLGFLWNQEVICNNNHVVNTTDNGISASRGNQKVVIVGNTCENICYSGIEVGGWVGDAGPRDFVISGNTLKNCGTAGIYLDEAPYYGTITGNTINQGFWHNAVDQLSDTVGVGIWVRGQPHGTPSAPTDFATGLLISGNTIRQSARAGIYLSGTKYSVVERNLILDTGTQFRSDGTTAISSSDTTTNVGVLVDFTATDSVVIVRDNIVIDTRVTPYTNYAVQPVPATSGIYVHNNTMLFCRNQPNTTTTLYTDTVGYLAGRQENMPRWAATALTSITMGSGVVRLSYVVARRTETITQIEYSTGNTAAGATPTLVRFGVYSVDSAGNLTLLASTASDTSIFAASQTDYARSLTSSIQVVEGQTYAVGVIVVTAAAAPALIGVLAATPSLNAQTPRLSASLTGQADLPASVTVGSLGATQSLPYAALMQ
jgi:parallel beta-helix repeat protein